MSQPSTKERILRAAGPLMLEKSFHSVGLNEILRTVGIPKGSFYHHFTSKEHFGAALIRHYAEQNLREHSEILLSPGDHPDARLRILHHLESRLRAFTEAGCTDPCLIMKLASEVGTSSTLMRREISQAYTTRVALLTSVISEAVEAGQTNTPHPPAQTAELLTSLWVGAVKQALAHQDPAPIANAIQFIRTNIIPAPAEQ